MPSRSSCLSRCESSVRESPGAPSRISLKLPQPRYRLRMISGVQRSAKISAPRAMGQYCPYVLTSASVAHPPSIVKSRFLTLPPAVHGSPMWPSREEDTMTTPTTAEIGHGEQAGADHELHRLAEKAGFSSSLQELECVRGPPIT